MQPTNRTKLSSGEFAKLCRTSKETLRHYRNLGVLVPLYESEKGYLYYDVEQFYDYYMIHILKKTGTPLAEIKAYLAKQHPDKVLEVLKKQQEILEEKKKEIEQMEQVIRKSITNIEIGNSNEFVDGEPTIGYFEKEHLLAIPAREFEANEDEDMTFVAMLQKQHDICQKYDVNSDYQLGAIIPQDHTLQGMEAISHIYTCIDRPSGNQYYHEKPAGYYVALRVRGEWDVQPFYKKLVEYIKAHEIRVIGDTYAYDVAGFLLNGQEEHTITMISIPVEWNKDVEEKLNKKV